MFQDGIKKVDRWVTAWWCMRTHGKDRVCWDNMAPDPLPGPEVWFCNNCKRTWTDVNKRPDRCNPSTVWGEHQTAWTHKVGPMPHGVRAELTRQRKDRDG